MGGRRLSAAQGTALYVGAVLGTGVVALPALAAKAAGPASWRRSGPGGLIPANRRDADAHTVPMFRARQPQA